MTLLDENNWYVAFTRSCQERKIAERLSARGIEVYVPTQKVKRKWSDRVKIIDKLVLPGLVFIHCREEQRRTLFDMVYGLRGFLSDKTVSGPSEALIVPDNQMDSFMHVVQALNGEADITFVQQPIEPGDMVRVVRGPLEGFVCECMKLDERQRLVIRLGKVGSIVANIDSADVVKVV